MQFPFKLLIQLKAKKFYII